MKWANYDVLKFGVGAREINSGWKSYLRFDFEMCLRL